MKIKQHKNGKLSLRMSLTQLNTLYSLCAHHIVGSTAGARGTFDEIYFAIKNAEAFTERPQPLPLRGDNKLLDLN